MKDECGLNWKWETPGSTVLGVPVCSWSLPQITLPGTYDKEFRKIPSELVGQREKCYC